MSTTGESQVWREALIDVYDLVRAAILRAWPECQTKIRSYVPPRRRKHRSERGRKSAQLEDPITRDLIIRLRRDEALRSRLIINSQRELLPESPEFDSDPLGYLDIAIEFFVRNEQLCLAMECKRLNVPRVSGPPETLAGRYIEEGMMRFVSRQYSPNLPLGGMIGYVMDGDLAAAHAAIRREIERAAATLGCQSPYIVVLQHPGYFSTDHARPPVPIQLRHLLVPAN
jgi:hypothetical protein